MPRPAVRALAIFWGAAALLLAALAGTLQWLGPPDSAPAPGPVAAPPAAHAPAPDVHAADAHAPEAQTQAAAHPPPRAPEAPAAHPPAPPPAGPPAPGSPIAPPDRALLELSAAYDDALLPRVGADGRMPMQVYAAGRNPAETRPRVAILVGDFGMNAQDSEQAVRGLPAAVSFAVSPYAVRTDTLLAATRARGHEMFAAVPMEPRDYPQSQAGSYALLTGAPPATNALRLEWALTRFSGYAGVTAALGPLHGERFAAAPELFATVLEEVARRGLLYVDPRPGAAPPHPAAMPPFRAVDVVIDAPPLRTEIDGKLDRLEQIARERGSALGLANDPLPMAVDRIGAWATALPARGFALVPVSALILPPDKPRQ